MKKIFLGFSLTLFFVCLSFVYSETIFASSCTQIGNTVFCDDGTRYDQIGNTTFGSDGSKYDNIGNTTFGNDGSRYDQIGNTIFTDDGTRYDIIGDNIFGSDGSSYQTIGNTTFGNGGANIHYSCPTNSSYDSLSGKCKCDYGYEYNGYDCVYKTITFPNAPTNQNPTKNYYSPDFDVPTTNIPDIIADNTNNNNQTCKEKHGVDAYLGTDGECHCKDGYPDIFDDQCITYDEACQWYSTNGEIMHGVGNADGTYNCYSCSDGFYWDETKKECLENKNVNTITKQNVSNQPITKEEKKENIPKQEDIVIDVKNNDNSYSNNDTKNPFLKNSTTETTSNTEKINKESVDKAENKTSDKVYNRIYSFFSSLFKKIKFW